MNILNFHLQKRIFTYLTLKELGNYYRERENVMLFSITLVNIRYLRYF